MMSCHGFCLSLIVLVLAALWSTGSAATCSDQKNCVSCASKRSWSGQSCRWCPRDKKCHAHASARNPCSRTQNIVSPSRCDNILAEYDTDLSETLLYLSAAAYAGSERNTQSCMNNALGRGKFTVHEFASKRCDIAGHRCMAFTAYSTEKQAIVVSFRGSAPQSQVALEGIRSLTAPRLRFSAGGKVEHYFGNAVNILWSDISSSVSTLVRRHPDYEVWVTGHSLGGALASIASARLVHEGKVQRRMVKSYTFGMPRVGNIDYARAHDRLVNNSFRVVNYRDLVPHLPTCDKVAGVCRASGGGVYHHGVEVFYPRRGSSSTSSRHRICRGLPHNEDIGCSNGEVNFLRPCLLDIGRCIDNHVNYFGINIGTFWSSNSCRT